MLQVPPDLLKSATVLEDSEAQSVAFALQLYSIEVRRQMTEERSCIDLAERLQNEADLASIESLEENWDGEGALAVDRKVVTNARRVLSFFESKRFSPTDVYASSNGTVVFEWVSGFSRANLEVGKTRYSYYLTTPGEATEYAIGDVAESFDKMASDVGRRIYEFDEQTFSTNIVASLV
jgi:hypothetical protein